MYKYGVGQVNQQQQQQQTGHPTTYSFQPMLNWECVAATNLKVSRGRIIFQKVSQRRIEKVSRGRMDLQKVSRRRIGKCRSDG